MARGDRDGDKADYYDILGVPATATGDDIARAYRRLARQHHPDSNPDGGSKRFQEITDAYGVIGDTERRRRYDAERRGGGHRGTKIPVNRGPAGTGTGAGREGAPDTPAAPRGGPTGAGPDRPVIHLSFREAVLGTVAVVEVTEDRRCPRCAGTGREPSDPAGCPDCGGSGSLTRRTGQIPVRHICGRCGGRGRRVPAACAGCGGSGTARGTHPVKVRVPAGVADGARLRIRRDPHPALEAVVRVEPDPRFGREGDHLTVRVPVTAAQAALGAKVAVPTVDGDPVALRIPAGTQPGTRLRLAGRGVRRGQQAGDLLVSVDVVIPSDLTEAERLAWEALAAVSRPAERQ